MNVLAIVAAAVLQLFLLAGCARLNWELTRRLPDYFEIEHIVFVGLSYCALLVSDTALLWFVWRYVWP